VNRNRTSLSRIDEVFDRYIIQPSKGARFIPDDRFADIGASPGTGVTPLSVPALAKTPADIQSPAQGRFAEWHSS
jgi:hypothetical protein